MATLTTSGSSHGLSFSGMNHLGLGHGFNLDFNVFDKTAKVYLCVGTDDNRVLVTGTTPRSRQEAVLAAIDKLGKWAQKIDLWMVSEKNGTTAAKTAPVKFLTHVKPYDGRLTITDFAAAQPRLTYPGNGHGRVLSERMNNRYYFALGGLLETVELNRGFDCTTFPMALLSIRHLPAPGYGKQLCDAAGAVQCELEQLERSDLEQRFADDSIPAGIYIVFSAGHVLLYNSDVNTLYEFNYGGFRATPAGERPMHAPQNLWWVRKLDEKYRPCFA